MLLWSIAQPLFVNLQISLGKLRFLYIVFQGWWRETNQHTLFWQRQPVEVAPPLSLWLSFWLHPYVHCFYRALPTQLVSFLFDLQFFRDLHQPSSFLAFSFLCIDPEFMCVCFNGKIILNCWLSLFPWRPHVLWELRSKWQTGGWEDQRKSDKIPQLLVLPLV